MSVGVGVGRGRGRAIPYLGTPVRSYRGNKKWLFYFLSLSCRQSPTLVLYELAKVFLSELSKVIQRGGLIIDKLIFSYTLTNNLCTS